jgi:tRNA pseudouridine55 synthase
MWDFEQGEVLAFDKPLHWTSFDVVAKVRWNLCQKIGKKKLKVGHTGTLDPLATGVVIVCTGKKTKLIDQLQYDVKEYIATLQLGATTPSYDLEKEIDATYPTAHITRELIDQTIPQFLGEQWQVPPMFSAVQINGKRAYELARKGETVELKPKLLLIDEIEVLSFDAETMLLTIRVVCSKGTYIRALARDIGERLNSGAHLIALRRTRVGNTRVEDCMTIEQFLEKLNEYRYVQIE